MTLDHGALAALAALVAGVQASALETERLDFKEDAAGEKESLRVVLDAALCMANTAGGTLVVGVDDDRGGPDALVGSALDPGRVRKYIHDNSRPRLLVECQEETYRGVRLVVIDVRADDEIYADTRG